MIKEGNIQLEKFRPGSIWESPQGLYYRVMGVNGRTGEATLRVGLRGQGNITRRGEFDTNNWKFVAPSLMGNLVEKDSLSAAP